MISSSINLIVAVCLLGLVALGSVEGHKLRCFQCSVSKEILTEYKGLSETKDKSLMQVQDEKAEEKVAEAIEECKEQQEPFECEDGWACESLVMRTSVYDRDRSSYPKLARVLVKKYCGGSGFEDTCVKGKSSMTAYERCSCIDNLCNSAPTVRISSIASIMSLIVVFSVNRL